MEEQRFAAQVEVAKQRCRCVIDAIQNLPRSTNITDSCRRTLLKSARAELGFLSRPSSSSSSAPLRKPVWIIVSDRNSKYISWNRCHRSKGLKLRIQEVLAAARSTLTLRPSSVILFFANGLTDHVYKKLRDEFEASEAGLELSVFSSDTLEDKEGDWINVIARSYKDACALEINVAGDKDVVSNCQGLTMDSSQLELSAEKAETQLQLSEENAKSMGTCQLRLSVPNAETQSEPSDENADTKLGDEFCSIVMGMKLSSLNNTNSESTESESLSSESNLVNFDTTALIALVSGISNSGMKKLLATPESELRQRFKGNYDFVVGQIISEHESPILVEFGRILRGKKGIICESVHTEFKELVLMCGGPNEKLRAEKLINCLRVVPDTPSERMMGLPTTRKLALKNKVVFGTGDCWHAPTLTANMAFVRAVSQTGMSLYTIEHRPRALTGD